MNTWYEAAANYRKSVVTAQFKSVINNQRLVIDEQQRRINHYNTFLASEMKEQIEHKFADRISFDLQLKITEAIKKYVIAGPMFNDIVTLQFQGSDLRFKTPSQIEKMVLDMYRHQVLPKLSFEISDVTHDQKITRYQIIIPQLSYGYDKVE